MYTCMYAFMSSTNLGLLALHHIFTTDPLWPLWNACFCGEQEGANVLIHANRTLLLEFVGPEIPTSQQQKHSPRRGKIMRRDSSTFLGWDYPLSLYSFEWSSNFTTLYPHSYAGACKHTRLLHSKNARHKNQPRDSWNPWAFYKLDAKTITSLNQVVPCVQSFEPYEFEMWSSTWYIRL